MRLHSNSPLAALVLALAVVAGVAGCGGGGGGGNSPTAPPMPPTGLTPTLSGLQAQVFSPTCARSGCHSAGSASAGLVLESGQSFSNLVNVASTEVPSLNRVTPNQPEQSYLVKKLRGDADIIGERMPRGGPFLTQADIDAFIAWINDGAPAN